MITFDISDLQYGHMKDFSKFRYFFASNGKWEALFFVLGPEIFPTVEA